MNTAAQTRGTSYPKLRLSEGSIYSFLGVSELLKREGKPLSGFSVLLDSKSIQDQKGKSIVIGTKDFRKLTEGESAQMGYYLISEDQSSIRKVTYDEAFKDGTNWYQRIYLRETAVELINNTSEGDNKPATVLVFENADKLYVSTLIPPVDGARVALAETEIPLLTAESFEDLGINLENAPHAAKLIRRK
jgi:hypothetical protein